MCALVTTGILESLVLKYSTHVLNHIIPYLNPIRFILISMILVGRCIFHRRKSHIYSYNINLNMVFQEAVITKDSKDFAILSEMKHLVFFLCHTQYFHHQHLGSASVNNYIILLYSHCLHISYLYR